MKANELMVGDYLMHNGFSYRVIQVDGIVRDGWMIENGEEDCGEPIPLTPEILEKNGFRLRQFSGNCMSGYWWERNDFIIHESMNDSVGKNNFKYEYVHQLQHALRLCGIEKEIEL